MGSGGADRFGLVAIGWLVMRSYWRWRWLCRRSPRLCPCVSPKDDTRRRGLQILGLSRSLQPAAKLLRVSVSAQFVCVFQAGCDSRWRRRRSARTQKHSNVLADMSGKLVPARGLRVAIGPLLRSVCDAGRLSLGRSTWPVECCKLGPVEISSWCDVASGVAMS